MAVSGVFNFVQGSLVMLTTIFCYQFVRESGWPTMAVLPLMLVFGAVSGGLTYLVAVRPALARSRQLTLTALLTTIGASTAINAVAALRFGSDTRPVPGYVSASPVYIGSIPLRPIYLVIAAAMVVVVVGFVLVLKHTTIGTLTRATLEDPEGARAVGINTNRVTLVAYGVAGCMAALAGWLVAPVTGASAFSAHSLAFFAFAGMAIGGFGSFSGSMVGGLAVGLVAGLVPAYTRPEFVVPAILGLVIATLVIRPSGLLGTAGLFGSKSVREI
jgi:branched-subunit amino acid ABC-type transport system permease component